MIFLNNILAHYSWQGVALVSLLVVLFFVQLYYYAIAYNRIYRFRLMRRRTLRCEQPPISVIVAVRGENEEFLSIELPTLLAQQYHTFEVVVIYIGNDEDYLRELQRIRDNNAHLRLTKLGGNERIYISTKQALNIGIKSAQYDNLLFTTPSAVPRSEEWVAYMAKGFERGMVVAAPAVPHFENDGLKSYVMRLTEFHRQRNAFARAVSGKLYYAPRSNYGFTRALYDSTRGYNHLSLDIGDNDLYLRAIATPKRTAVVLSAHSIVEEERPAAWGEWMELMRYYDTTKEHYPADARRFARRELVSRTLFMLAAIAALVVLPHELRIATAVVMLLRYAIVVWSSRRTARKLGERNIALLYWIYDIFGPVVELLIARRSSHSTPKVWR
ncbi:MAG: glycosyltransferase [Alistipes sp.]|nr:glycosyltransferase [Alistipes sp.]